MDSIPLDATSCVTVVVGIFFIYVIFNDIKAWVLSRLAQKPKPQQPVAAPATTSATATATTAPATTEPSNVPPPTASPTATEPPAQEKKKVAEPVAAETPKEAAAPAAEAAPAAPAATTTTEDPLIDNLLDSALDELDSAENVIDQAWDKVHGNLQVSTHVSGLDTFLQDATKNMQEAMAKSKQAKQEEKIEATRAQRAEQLRKQGNAAYERRQYDRAITMYSEAIRLLPDADENKAVLFCNRSAANKNAGHAAAATKDARRCVELNPTSVKGHMREAEALEEEGKPGDAKSVYQRVVSTFPKHQLVADAKDGIVRCDEKMEALLDF